MAQKAFGATCVHVTDVKAALPLINFLQGLSLVLEDHARLHF